MKLKSPLLTPWQVEYEKNGVCQKLGEGAAASFDVAATIHGPWR